MLTLSQLCDRWMTDYCRLEKAESQWVTDESAIRIHLKPALGDLELRQITKATLTEFRTAMRQKLHPKSKRPLSVKTVNHVLALLKKILQTAVDWDLIPGFPAATLKSFREAEQKIAYWTAAERDRFIRFARHVDPAFAEAVTVAVWSGLRMSELGGLTVKQLDFEKRLITVDRIYCFKSKQRLERTKNLGIGYVPMAEPIAEALTRCKMMATTAPVFPLETFRHASQRLRRLAKKAGVTSIRFHDLRHTFASVLVQNGVELYTVQRLMRHKTAAMTQRYAHLAPNTLQAAMSRIDGTKSVDYPKIPKENK